MINKNEIQVGDILQHHTYDHMLLVTKLCDNGCYIVSLKGEIREKLPILANDNFFYFDSPYAERLYKLV